MIQQTKFIYTRYIPNIKINIKTVELLNVLHMGRVLCVCKYQMALGVPCGVDRVL